MKPLPSKRATAIGRLLAPATRYFQVESAGGLMLLSFTAAALLLANSPFAADFLAFWQRRVGLGTDVFNLDLPLLLWINDGLMVLFFFVVGLEIKREIVAGELAEPGKALLPVLAAVGGMTAPAVLYCICLGDRPGGRGWAVPMATDIAFVVGFLSLLGARVPRALKVLLLTLAIADDIGAVLVIATVYSGDIAFVALGLAGAGLGVVLVLRLVGVGSVPVYTILGAAIWLGFLKSGVHPTVAGVLLGLLTPARCQLAWGSPSPAERLEMALHPWVAFGILPLFALANAGVPIEVAGVGRPVAFSVAAGLILGKPLGIVLFSAAAVKLRLAQLPAGITWKIMVGAGCLGGIGFTMSLFIAGLAYHGNMLADAKIGILMGSAVSAVLGCLLLLAVLPAPVERLKQLGLEPPKQ